MRSVQSKLIEKKREELPGLSQNNLRLGETLIYQSPTVGRWTHTKPAGTTAYKTKGENINIKPRQVGLHTLQQEDTTHTFALNVLSEQESDLSGNGPHRQGAKETAHTMRQQASLLTPYFGLLALLFTLWSWRVTRVKE